MSRGWRREVPRSFGAGALPMTRAGRAIRRRRVAAGLTVLGLLLAAAAGANPEEYRLKAAFLMNFARLVEWPPAARPAPGEPLVVGVYGDSEVAADLERALAGATVDRHPVATRALTDRSQIAGCQIVFIASPDPDDAVAWAEASGAHSALSVGESPGFAGHGGVINFFQEGERLRFEINYSAAERYGLKISSRLLRLARLVTDAH